MAKIDLLRQLIREEVIKALRQELPRLLSENISSNKRGIDNVIKEIKKSDIPITLNTVETYQKNINQKFSNNSPLDKLLKETAISMQEDEIKDFNFNTDSVNPISYFQPKEVEIGDVNSMLSTARASSNMETVQINQVPDYSQLMKKMLDKGAM